MEIKVYRTYRFIDKDPVIDAMRTILDDEGLKIHQAGQVSGLADGTLSGWFERGTRQPRNSSVTAFTSALGYVRRDSLDKHGQLHVGYVKARDIDDWQAEIKKAGDWLLKQNSGPKRRRRKRKTNGHANGNGHAK